MHLRELATASALLATLLATPTVVRADWHVGPLDNGTAITGANGTIDAIWYGDPDGAGPLGPTLIVGGSFDHIGGVLAHNVAALDPATGSWVALGNGTPNAVNSLAIFNGQLVAGCQGSLTPGNQIQAFDGSSWHSLAAGTTFNGTVFALTVWNNSLIAGGNLTITTGTGTLTGVASFDGSAWHSIGGGTNNSVLALINWSGDLYAGGTFSVVGGSPISGIAHWNGSAWAGLGGTGEQVGSLAASTVS